MKLREKGYSLNVLVITIAVMLILTTTAIVSMKNLTKDKEITKYMADLQEVEDFVKEYYSRKKTLPVVQENGISRIVTLTEEMQKQADPEDVGDYYEVDLNKLDKIKLNDDERLYIVNEGSLRIYTVIPIEYESVKYYTLTNELLGKNRIYGNSSAFEVVVTGNPMTWVSSARLMVSIPDVDNINENWTLKYYKDGPITAKQFQDFGTFFGYGQSITINENGVYSIYVENEEGISKVTNVVVKMIDEKKPYVYREDNKVIVGDDETGISRVMYKIYNYDIRIDKRAETPEMVEAYMQGTEEHLPTAAQGGKWTFEQAYTGEQIEGIEASIGKSINTYKRDYEDFLRDYNESLTNPEIDIEELCIEYPQFIYKNDEGEFILYGDNEENIVLYLEDYSMNRTVTDQQGELSLFSRYMLLNNNFIDVIIKPLNNVEIQINDNEEYTTSNIVDLKILRGQGAEYIYLTTDEEELPPENIDDWRIYENFIENFELPETAGETSVYLYITANQMENGTLKYEEVFDTIYLDNLPPTDTAPVVAKVDNTLRLNVTFKQVDNESGLFKYEYGYKLKDDEAYRWVSDLGSVTLEPNKTYYVKTRATDRAGNERDSIVVEVQTPLQAMRTIPNEPVMATGMKAIVWDGTLGVPGDEIEINPITGRAVSGDTEQEFTWYNYSLGDGITDTRDNIWANAKTSDGSYWVWIPRFAYMITYYENVDKDVIKGYYKNSTTGESHFYEDDGTTIVANPDEVKSEYLNIDIVFLKDDSDNEYREENLATKAINIKTLSGDYIVHPAFRNIEGTAVNNSLGKWSTNLSGIWVAKFEASRSDATIDEEGVLNTIKILPSKMSARGTKIADMYSYSLSMNPSLHSHLMKNSEWGAVTYLAYSPYGRNGHEISSNRSEYYITGGGGLNGSYMTTTSMFLSTYAYNARDFQDGKSGMYASTTGNVYGVYDMAGGLAEYVATYINNGETNIGENGRALTQTTSTYLREIFPVGNPDSPINNYRRLGLTDNIYGNAIYETSTGYIGKYGVDDDNSNYPSLSNPFFIRGGKATDGTGSGVFAFDYADGAASNNIGFRPVITVR